MLHLSKVRAKLLLDQVGGDFGAAIAGKRPRGGRGLFTKRRVAENPQRLAAQALRRAAAPADGGADTRLDDPARVVRLVGLLGHDDERHPCLECSENRARSPYGDDEVGPCEETTL